jgi:hypothetical protein
VRPQGRGGARCGCEWEDQGAYDRRQAHPPIGGRLRGRSPGKKREGEIPPRRALDDEAARAPVRRRVYVLNNCVSCNSHGVWVVALAGNAGSADMWIIPQGDLEGCARWRTWGSTWSR